MAQLEIFTTENGKRIYTDKKTGAHEDVSVFEPNIPDGFYMVGHYGQQDHADFMKGTVPLVKPLAGNAIATPIGFEQEWNDKGSDGKHHVSFWRVVAPPGYVALGDVINIGYDPPPDSLKEKYACIRDDLVIQGKIGDLIWKDRGSKAKLHGSLWSVEPTIQGVTGYFKVQQGYDPPTDGYAFCMRAAV